MPILVFFALRDPSACGHVMILLSHLTADQTVLTILYQVNTLEVLPRAFQAKPNKIPIQSVLDWMGVLNNQPYQEILQP